MQVGETSLKLANIQRLDGIGVADVLTSTVTAPIEIIFDNEK